MALIHIYIFWTINETSSCGLWINRMTTRSCWKFRICAISNDLTLYSFSSLYIFVTWGWPRVAETCRQPNKTDTKTVVFWRTYLLLIYLCYMNRRIMQIIGFPNIVDLFTCCKIFFCSETFTKSCGKRWGLVLGYTTYVTAISTMWSMNFCF